MSYHPEGVKWRKWDLHCHTPDDPNWEGKPDSSEREKFIHDYLQKFKDAEIEVIAITDHFFYGKDIKKSYLHDIMEKAPEYGITVIPGAEVTSKDLSGIHILLYFPEDIDLSILQTFLIKIHPSIQREADNTVPLSSCNIQEIFNLRENG